MHAAAVDVLERRLSSLSDDEAQKRLLASIGSGLPEVVRSFDLSKS
jgi:hypothetical protein